MLISLSIIAVTILGRESTTHVWKEEGIVVSLLQVVKLTNIYEIEGKFFLSNISTCSFCAIILTKNNRSRGRMFERNSAALRVGLCLANLWYTGADAKGGARWAMQPQIL